jgi:hypothetical protein
MTTAAAGYTATVSTSTDGSTYHQVTLSTDMKPGGVKNDMLDRTYYGQGDRQKRRSAGLKDNSGTFKVDYLQSDARVQEIIAAGEGGTDFWIQVLYDGTNGWKAKGIIESYDVAPPINGKVEVTFTWLPNADKTSVP